MEYRKKLIEVSLPLEAISEASVREKSIRHGHPSTLHLWWSRKPLAASRAVLFASLVDDPSAHADIFDTEEKQATERERLFDIMRKLIKWENSNNKEVLQQAREEILKSAEDGILPPFLDPFAGGGSIPLEALRLGLESHASDLNPVAILLNKALIEIPPKFANMPPINLDAQNTLLQRDWHGTQGLADDIRYYGKWMRDEAKRRIGHLYPQATLPNEYGGGKTTVIAWLWVRTVACPNPACGAQMPLTSKWWLSKKKGKLAWVKPTVDLTSKHITYDIVYGTPDAKVVKEIDRGTSYTKSDGKKVKATFKCEVCGIGIAKGDYIDDEANAGRMSHALTALVVESKNGRLYLPAESNQREAIIRQSVQYLTTTSLSDKIPTQPSRGTFASNAQGRIYGFKTFADYFTERQLATLLTFSDLIGETKEKLLADARLATFLREEEQKAYAEAIVTYLALAVDRGVDYWSSICSWHAGRDTIRNTFARQGIPMIWDFAEANPFSDSSGNFAGAVDWVAEVIELAPCSAPGVAVQRDATTSVNGLERPFISTDPPYYDNVSYADLSDFFYVWLRRSLSPIYPDLFGTMLTPKTQELVATPYRFDGSRQKAQQFFENGLHQTFERMRAVQHPDYPLTVYYAFKQAETEVDKTDIEDTADTQSVASTGWETMLAGLISAGFMITGTWPMRTEMMNRSVGQNTNALASSIVLVCRPRPIDAPSAWRRQFINELREELEEALKKMQHDGIAPVDLAQASIGPGMKVYSQYSQILESNGLPLSVHTALQLINRELDSILAAQEAEYDFETRWAVAWFGEHAMEVGLYGQAETFSKAKNISLHSLVEAGLLEAKAGKVRLRKRDELVLNWQPEMNDHRKLTAWEVMQRMIHALDKQGTGGAGAILSSVPEYGEAVRDLAYHLYNICERKEWNTEGLYYNMLVSSWSEIQQKARELAKAPQQAALSFD